MAYDVDTDTSIVLRYGHGMLNTTTLQYLNTLDVIFLKLCICQLDKYLYKVIIHI